MNAITYKIRTTQHTRTLTNGSKYVHKSYEIDYRTADGVWHAFPDRFSDRAQAKRCGEALKRGESW